MLEKSQPVAIYMEGSLGDLDGKMGYGVLRFSPNPVCCVIDSRHAGKQVGEVIDAGRDCPVVDSIEAAARAGAEVLVLGIAPSGGRIPESWTPALRQALAAGMSIVNGLHDFLAPRFKAELAENQWIWDVRNITSPAPPMAMGRAAALGNKRVLMVGTDMAIGKMTAGLEINRWLLQHSVNSAFVATGQIGITIAGSGVPLDAVKVDHSCGWIESHMLKLADKDVVIVEGQGSLLHPGSSATLPLMRGACPNYLVLCHKAGMKKLDTVGVPVPPLKEVIRLNEMIASAAGALTAAKTIGIALNTAGLDHEAALREIARTEDETGLPVTDVVRMGAEKIACLLRG